MSLAISRDIVNVVGACTGEFCLDFYSRRDNMLRHTKKCLSGRHPPGDEIYRHDGIAFFEIDGSKVRKFENCLLALDKLDVTWQQYQ